MRGTAQTHGRTAAESRRAALVLCACAAVFLCACRKEQRAAAATGENDVPVALNGESPFQYPATLYDQGVEGEVRLLLYVDALGRVVPESTRIAASSGTPALDSAAIAGSAQLRFAPAHKNGQPVAAAFVQPVIFKRNAAPPSGAAN